MKIKQKQNIFFKRFRPSLKRLLIFGTFLLMNNLFAQTVSISSLDNTAGEVASGTANTASFTISRNVNVPTATEVSFKVTGTSSTGDDHDLADGVVKITFISTQSVTTIINIIDDILVEGIETIVITLDQIISGAGTIDPLANEVEINIVDNDICRLVFDPTNVGFVDEAYEENEVIGNFRMKCTNYDGSVSRNGTGADIVVNYTLATGTNVATGPGTAAADDFNFFGDDGAGDVSYDPVNDVFLIADQTGNRHVNVVPNDDGDAEDSETITVTLTSTNNSLFTIGAVDEATVTIIDNDCIAGDTAPTLKPTAVTERCDVNVLNLNTLIVGGTGSAPAGSDLRWSQFQNPTSEAELYNNATVSNTGIYYALYWVGGASPCASPTTEVVLTFSESPNAGADGTATACNNADNTFGATIIDLDDLLDANVDTGGWAYVSGPEEVTPNANNRVQFRNKDAGNYVFNYITTTAVAPCTNDTATFTITVADCDPCVAGTEAPTLSASAPETTYCRDVGNNELITIDLDDFTNSTPPSGTELRWTTISDLENENAHLTTSVINRSTGATYRGFFWDDANSCASPALVVALLIKPIPELTVGADQERCGTGKLTFTASATVGTTENPTINWYTQETGGNLAGSGTSFTTPNLSETTSYFVSATLNGCTSERIEVVAKVAQQPSAGIIQNNGNTSACSVKDNGPNLIDLDDVISGQDAGSWVFTSGPVANFTIPNNKILDFEGAEDGAYVFTYTTIGAEAPCVNETSTVSISVNDCDVDTDLDGLLDGVEAELGTLFDNPDTDGDGINDGDEVGADQENPIDTDEDDIIDALDSNIIDSDMDGVVDQLDPANENPCIPDNTIGLCDTDDDDIPDGVEIENGSDPLDPCSPNIEAEACVDPTPVDLEITKVVNNPAALMGEEVVFTITVNNLSTSKAKSIIVGELLEDGFMYEEHEASIGNYDETTGEWSIFELEASGSATLAITVTILEGASNYSNTAELLSSFPVDETDANNQATVEFTFEVPEGVNLILEKKVSLGLLNTKLDSVTGLINTLNNELEVFYFIKVTNDSKEDVVSNIRVNDVFSNPTGLQYEIDQENIPAETSFNPESGIWQINKSLQVDEEIELSYRVVFTGIGIITNTATIESSSPRESLSAEEDKDSSGSAVVTITTRNKIDVGILYNQFSPNNDGLNDNLKINLIRTNEDNTEELVSVLYDIQIFNRYGNLVYEAASKNAEEVWNGSWDGKDAPDGTYFYNMTIEIEGEGIKTQKGWIQLIR